MATGRTDRVASVEAALRLFEALATSASTASAARATIASRRPRASNGEST